MSSIPALRAFLGVVRDRPFGVEWDVDVSLGVVSFEVAWRRFGERISTFGRSENGFDTLGLSADIVLTRVFIAWDFHRFKFLVDSSYRTNIV